MELQLKLYELKNYFKEMKELGVSLIIYCYIQNNSLSILVLTGKVNFQMFGAFWTLIKHQFS